jgi:dihydropteroate synthase
MQDKPCYQQVVPDVLQYLSQRRDDLLEQGIDHPRICLDPGIGFGKTHAHNLQLLAGVSRFHETGCPILVGHSRKGFIRKFSGDPTRQQLAGTLAVSLHLAHAGIQIIRVHDVLQTRQALLIQQAIDDAKQESKPSC